MKLGSLFSGAGGLDMAVKAVFGAETVWHCENDAAASTVLAARCPGTPNHGDITTTDWSQVAPVDVLCGGWPCQPFSLAGQRKGAQDDRALWPYVARAVRMVRPRIVVLENVSAVLGPEFQRVADDLAEAGYDIAWTCLRASDVGAPHRRERVFILATDTRRKHGRAWYPQPKGVDGATEQSERCASTLEGQPKPARLERKSDAAVSGAGPVDLLPTPTARDHKGRDLDRQGGKSLPESIIGDDSPLLPTPRSSDCFGPCLHGNGGLDFRTTISLLATPSTADGNGGHLNRSGARKGELLLPGRAREMGVPWGKYEPAIRRWEHLTRPAPAPTGPNKNGNPRLAAAFSEWLMGWPEGWVTQVPGISRNYQLRIIGNGVCPQQAHAALLWLLNVSAAAGIVSSERIGEASGS